MPRKPRVHVTGGLYHVILRGNDRKDIFHDDRARFGFLDLLSEGTARFGYRVHAFCLMSNHVHLAIQAGEERLAKAMQNVGFRHALRTNWKTGSSGHLFQGRFQAILVGDVAYVMALLRYIHLNPVKAGLVKDPADWRWSSHRAYLGDASWKFLTTSWVLEMLSEEPVAARGRYLELVLADEPAPEERDERLEGFLGVSSRDAADSRPFAPRPSLDEIVQAVCARFETTPERLGGPGCSRSDSEARSVVVHLALHLRSAALVDVARVFSRDRSGLGHGLRRLQVRMESDLALARRVDTLIQSLGSDPRGLSVTIPA